MFKRPLQLLYSSINVKTLKQSFDYVLSTSFRGEGRLLKVSCVLFWIYQRLSDPDLKRQARNKVGIYGRYEKYIFYATVIVPYLVLVPLPDKEIAYVILITTSENQHISHRDSRIGLGEAAKPFYVITIQSHSACGLLCCDSHSALRYEVDSCHVIR